jgi:hypothetical protein
LQGWWGKASGNFLDTLSQTMVKSGAPWNRFHWRQNWEVAQSALAKNVLIDENG